MKNSKFSLQVRNPKLCYALRPASVECTGRENKAFFCLCKTAPHILFKQKCLVLLVHLLHFGQEKIRKNSKQNQKPYKKNPNPNSNGKIRAFGNLSSWLWPHCYCETKRFFHGLNARENTFWEKLWKKFLPWLLLWSGTCRVLTRNFSFKQAFVTASQLSSLLRYSQGLQK